MFKIETINVPELKINHTILVNKLNNQIGVNKSPLLNHYVIFNDRYNWSLTILDL